MKLTPMFILRERALCRAFLYLQGEYSFEEARLPLFAYAEGAGLIRRYGGKFIVSVIDQIFEKAADRMKNNLPILEADHGSVPLPGAPGNISGDADSGVET